MPVRLIRPWRGVNPEPERSDADPALNLSPKRLGIGVRPEAGASFGNPQFPFSRFPIGPGKGEGVPRFPFGQIPGSGNPRFIWIPMISRSRFRRYPKMPCLRRGSTVTALSGSPSPTLHPTPPRRRSVPRGARASGFRSSHLVHCIACCVVSAPLVFVACFGTGRMVVLNLVWRLCRVAHWVSSAIPHTAGCSLPAARRTQNAAVPCVSCCISHVLGSSCMPSAV
jgi:hypothetical protein